MPSWKFLNPRDRDAAALRREMETKIDAWWHAFKTKASDMDALFRGRQEWDLAEWMHRQLGAVDERIMWEFGPSDGGHRLVLTPEVHRNLRPMVETMLERGAAAARLVVRPRTARPSRWRPPARWSWPRPASRCPTPLPCGLASAN